ncbi:DUF2207 domain-containing protein [Senegalia sp. (in: firmicutes)]|uniref:DUF2207 domain-containing protein n=1 Tax=Senegalia sp. (in: firmicutes) TaxID=1924098 RepID=UPI003F9755DF
MFKIKIKKIILIIISFLMLFNLFGAEKIYAKDQTLENLDIKVFINDDGSASVSQRREGTFKEGTENFLVVGNLGKSKIKDFKVFENGREYEFIEDWDTEKNIEEKAFKNGLIETSNGYELIWGIGEYGRHEYVIEYTVTDFIKEVTDNQMLFWRFVNDKTNTPPQNVRITIESNEKFTKEDEEIWSFGFDGNVEFDEDGMIVAKNTKPLTEDSYVTILAKFEKGMFETNDYIEKPFGKIKDQAFAGSDFGGRAQSSNFFSIATIVVIFAIILNFFLMRGRYKKSKDKKFKRKYVGEYYKDYPYKGNIIDVYYILYKMGLNSFKNILNGFLLKWIKEGKIEVSNSQDQKIQIHFLDKNSPKEESEAKLYNILLEAAGDNDILEEKEFAKWSKTKYSKISDWKKEAKEKSIEKLKSLGYIEVEEERKLFFKSKEYHLRGKGKEIEDNIYKYINYLYDYSVLREDENTNFEVLDNMIVWAGFLGLTDVVKGQFEKIHPTYTQATMYMGNSIFMTNSFATRAALAQVSANNSVTGGNSSIGGGGGSFGGGSGGGTR